MNPYSLIIFVAAVILGAIAGKAYFYHQKSQEHKAFVDMINSEEMQEHQKKLIKETQEIIDKYKDPTMKLIMPNKNI